MKSILTFPYHLTRELLRGIGMGCEILCPREESRDEIFFPGFDSSAGSATSEAGVEPAEQVPTPESALPQPGVGHPNPLDHEELSSAAFAIRKYADTLGSGVGWYSLADRFALAALSVQ